MSGLLKSIADVESKSTKALLVVKLFKREILANDFIFKTDIIQILKNNVHDPLMEKIIFFIYY